MRPQKYFWDLGGTLDFGGTPYTLWREALHFPGVGPWVSPCFFGATPHLGLPLIICHHITFISSPDGVAYPGSAGYNLPRLYLKGFAQWFILGCCIFNKINATQLNNMRVIWKWPYVVNFRTQTTNQGSIYIRKDPYEPYVAGFGCQSPSLAWYYSLCNIPEKFDVFEIFLLFPLELPWAYLEVDIFDKNRQDQHILYFFHTLPQTLKPRYRWIL